MMGELKNAIPQPVDDLLSKMADTIEHLQTYVAELEKQLKPVAVLSRIQQMRPEKESDGSDGIWFRARSANAPKTGPHGRVLCSCAEPSIDLFQPVNISPHSDDVYLLARLYPILTTAQKQLLEKATEFSIACTLSVDSPSNVQQLELDMQKRTSDGVLANFGLAWTPDGHIRLFDYEGKAWVTQSPRVPMLPDTPVRLKLDAVCDGKTVNFTQLTANGDVFPLDWSHSVKIDRGNAPYFNIARQYDGKASAPAYTVTVGNLEATFS